MGVNVGKEVGARVWELVQCKEAEGEGLGC